MLAMTRGMRATHRMGNTFGTNSQIPLPVGAFAGGLPGPGAAARRYKELFHAYRHS